MLKYDGRNWSYEENIHVHLKSSYWKIGKGENNFYALTSACIFSILFSIHFLRCWQGEFHSQSIISLVRDHFLYSHHLNMWFRVILRGEIRCWSLSDKVSNEYVNDTSEKNSKINSQVVLIPWSQRPFS